MSNLENRMQKDLYTEKIISEANEDFILPDYMPEIGRILRVTTSLFPEECYVGNDGVDFSGRVSYRLLYSDSEGNLTEAPLEGRYRYRTPRGEKSDGKAYTEESIESVSTRPTAPRKLNIRTRISARPHLLYDEDISASVISEAAHAESKFRHLDAAWRTFCNSGVLHKEERFEETGVGPEMLSLISVENAVLPEDSIAHDGYISTRGKILFTLLLRRGEETPYVRTFTLPYEEDITHAECETGDALTLKAHVGEPAVSFEETENGTAVSLETDLSLNFVCTRNRPMTVLDDFYYYGERHEVTKKPHEGMRLVGAQMGNATVSCELPFSEDTATLGTLLPHLTLKEVCAHTEGDRVILEGTLDALLLSFAARAAERWEMTLPFRAELSLGVPTLPEDALSYSVTPVGGYAQVGKNGVRISTELFLCATVSRPFAFSIPVSSVKTADIALPPPPALTLYYPTDGDTLWSVGKKYGVSTEKLRKQNGIPAEGDTAFDDEAPLDGYAYLFVQGL